MDGPAAARAVKLIGTVRDKRRATRRRALRVIAPAVKQRISEDVARAVEEARAKRRAAPSTGTSTWARTPTASSGVGARHALVSSFPASNNDNSAERLVLDDAPLAPTALPTAGKAAFQRTKRALKDWVGLQPSREPLSASMPENRPQGNVSYAHSVSREQFSKTSPRITCEHETRSVSYPPVVRAPEEAVGRTSSFKTHARKDMAFRPAELFQPYIAHEAPPSVEIKEASRESAAFRTRELSHGTCTAPRATVDIGNLVLWKADTVEIRDPDRQSASFAATQRPGPKRHGLPRPEGTRSKHRGVAFADARNEWRATLALGSRRYVLGYYKDADSAGRAYDGALRLCGLDVHVPLNFPGEGDQAAEERLLLELSERDRKRMVRSALACLPVPRKTKPWATAKV
jgi:hypothetical protein